MFKNKIFFVTGGTGSFGKHFIKILLKKHDVRKVIIFSRDELKQFEMKNDPELTKYNKKLRFFIGDIRDRDRLNYALNQKIDYVIHAAALKHVPLAEYNPYEAVKTNIIGAQNIVDLTTNYNIEKVITLSTDKAASPINLYGATKLASDKIMIAANNYSKKTKFSVVRYGNVFASRGSVVPFFIDIKKKGYFPITDKRMTRFNLSLSEGVELVLFATYHSIGGEIFVPKIPSFKITDLAKAIDPKLPMKVIGIRPGEKLHEEMITLADSQNTIEFSNYYIIKPNSEYYNWNLKHYLKKTKSKKFKRVNENFSYNSFSNKKYLKVSDLKKIISKFK